VYVKLVSLEGLARMNHALMCSSAQKYTEWSLHDFTRPLQIRVYARIQVFPDDCHFEGAVSQQYKLIGNAVLVNMARAIGELIVVFLALYNDEIDW
jgi:DNA (cytosine-5)-methyltransferase 1